MSWTTVKGLQSQSLQTRIVPGTISAIAPLALSLSLCLVAGSKVEAANFSFTKIADTSTSVPESVGNFTSFGNPALDNGIVAFTGFGPSTGLGSSNQAGVYTNTDGVLNVVANTTNTPVPGSAGNFSPSFSSPSLDNGSVAFQASSSSSGSSFVSGIYTNINGTLNVVANTNTPVPGSTGNFENFSNPALDNGNVAFSAFDGIYTNTGGTLNQVLNRTTTTIPGGTGNFTSFGSLVLDNGIVAFQGSGLGQIGVYTSTNGMLNIVANPNTAIPEGTGNFTSFGSPALDNGIVAFQGSGSGQSGVYTSTDGMLNIVANTNTAIPEGRGNFTSFDTTTALDNGNVVFSASGAARQQGIYTTLGESLTKVLASGDALDDKTVFSLFINREAISEEQIALRVRFTDNSQGIYVATAVPEPTSVLSVLAIGALGVTGVLKRQR